MLHFSDVSRAREHGVGVTKASPTCPCSPDTPPPLPNPFGYTHHSDCDCVYKKRLYLATSLDDRSRRAVIFSHFCLSFCFALAFWCYSHSLSSFSRLRALFSALYPTPSGIKKAPESMALKPAIHKPVYCDYGRESLPCDKSAPKPTPSSAGGASSCLGVLPGRDNAVPANGATHVARPPTAPVARLTAATGAFGPRRRMCSAGICARLLRRAGTRGGPPLCARRRAAEDCHLNRHSKPSSLLVPHNTSLSRVCLLWSDKTNATGTRGGDCRRASESNRAGAIIPEHHCCRQHNTSV
jgi:hypothetical protein